MSIEPGKTYELQPGPDSPQHPDAGRKALALERLSEDGEVWAVRWPNGFETVAQAKHLKGPIDRAKPGVDEPCLICRGQKEVEMTRPKADEPWSREVVGRKPCPNCGEAGGS